MKRLLFLIFVCLLVSCTAQENRTKERREVQACLDSLVLAKALPGANFSIILPDGSIENYSSGFEDIEAELQLKPDRVLFSGSIGKTYAAAVLFQLIDEGKVSLDDKIYNYFTEIEWIDRIPNIQDITIEMLLQHTSGLPRWVMGAGVWSALNEDPDKVWTYEDRFSFIFDIEPIFSAGERWGYSDTNYLLLGMLIEKLCGEDYYKVVNERILGPMRLESTHASLRRDIPDLSQGYSKLPPEFLAPPKVVEEGRYFFNPQMEWTGGGFASTTSDLARWAEIYFTGQLFSDSLLARVRGEKDKAVNLGPSMSFGMASFIYNTSIGKAYEHSGFVPGFNSSFAYFPEHKIAVAFQSNCDYAGSSLPLVAYLEILVKNYIKETEEK